MAYSCYQDNLWTITEMKNDLSDMSVRFQNAMNDKNAFYNLKIWFFNKNFFKPIDDYKIMPSQGVYKSRYKFMVNYNFKDGQYSAMNDLAHASVLESDHPSGEGKVLNITFRGTEFSRLPAYILKAYPDMTAYYANFIPFEEAIMKYARNPANNIKEIQVSGHSLGGAMVQEFLHNNPPKNSEPEIHGFTFGSPGSKKHFFHKFATLGYQNV